jgi:hypothetical protein
MFRLRSEESGSTSRTIDADETLVGLGCFIEPREAAAMGLGAREPSFMNPFTPAASFERSVKELETATSTPPSEADVRAKMAEAAAAREAATAIAAARRIGVGGQYHHAKVAHANSTRERATPSRADADESPTYQFEKVAGTRPPRTLKDKDLLSPFEQL